MANAASPPEATSRSARQTRRRQQTGRAAQTGTVTTRRPDRVPGSPLGTRLIAEFIGTFFLVLTVCAATSPKTGAGPLAPFAIGAILMAMVFAGGHVSGGHYNPAVSLAVMIRGKLTAAEWLGYASTQLAAAAAGGVVARGIVGGGRPETTANTGKIFLVELLFTFALAYVVLSVATARAGEGNSYFGLAIGFTVAAGAFAVGGISGAAFNPAVALGVSILGRFAWNQLWIYIVATLAGATAAPRHSRTCSRRNGPATPT